MPLEILDSSSFFSPEMLSLLAFCGNCDILCAVHSDCAPSGECGVGTSFYHTSKITMDFLFSSVQLHYAINPKKKKNCLPNPNSRISNPKGSIRLKSVDGSRVCKYTKSRERLNNLLIVQPCQTNQIL